MMIKNRSFIFFIIFIFFIENLYCADKQGFKDKTEWVILKNILFENTEDLDRLSFLKKKNTTNSDINYLKALCILKKISNKGIEYIPKNNNYLLDAIFYIEASIKEDSLNKEKILVAFDLARFSYNFNNIIKYSEKLLNLGYKDEIVYNSLIISYLNSEQTSKALSLTNEAIERFNSPFFEELKLDILLQTNRKKYYSLLQTLYEQDSTNISVLMRICDKEARENPLKFSETIAKIYKIYPSYIPALELELQFYLSVNDITNAFFSFEKMIQNNNIKDSVIIKKANDIFLTQKMYSEYYPYVKNIISLIEKRPQSYLLLEFLGIYYYRIGDIAQSCKIYNNVYSLLKNGNGEFKKIETTLSFLFEASIMNSDIDSAKKYLDLLKKESIDNNASLVGYHISESIYYQKIKDIDKAIETLKEIKDTKRERFIHSLIGSLYMSEGEYQKAKKYLENSISSEEENFDNNISKNNLAYCYALLNIKLKKALILVDEAMENTSISATYLDTKGWILYKMKRLEEARKALQKAVSLSTNENYNEEFDSKELYEHYVIVLKALGETSLAKIYEDKIKTQNE